MEVTKVNSATMSKVVIVDIDKVLIVNDKKPRKPCIIIVDIGKTKKYRSAFIKKGH